MKCPLCGSEVEEADFREITTRKYRVRANYIWEDEEEQVNTATLPCCGGEIYLEDISDLQDLLSGRALLIPEEKLKEIKINDSVLQAVRWKGKLFISSIWNEIRASERVNEDCREWWDMVYMEEESDWSKRHLAYFGDKLRVKRIITKLEREAQEISEEDFLVEKE